MERGFAWLVGFTIAKNQDKVVHIVKPKTSIKSPDICNKGKSSMATYFLRLDEASHLESGSNPAGSFCSATTKMPFSIYVVYTVSNIMNKK